MDGQKGGLEPATAALIALLGVGGVSAYGASAMNKNAEALLDEKSGGIIGQLKTITTNLTSERDTLRKEVERLKADMQRKEFEVNKKVQELKSRESKISQLEAGTGPALVFKNATTETLERAIPVTVKKLGEFATGKPGYEWLLDETKLKNIVDALEYPTTYQGKLMRLTLPAFYEKRIKKAAQIDYDISKPKEGKGRRRRRRGGDEPVVPAPTEPVAEPATEPVVPPTEPVAEPATEPVAPATEPVAPPTAPAFPFPTYEEFAKLYSEAIDQVSLTGVQEIAKKSKEFRKSVDEKAEAKRNQTAKKAAIALADSLQKVIQQAKKDIKQYPSTVVPDLRTALEEDIVVAEILSAPLPPPLETQAGGARNLREITTEEDWNNTKQRAQALKDSIPKKVKEYIQAAKKKPSATTPEVATPTPAVLEDSQSDSIHKEILDKTPKYISKVKDRLKEFEKLWDQAKTARDSICTGGGELLDYKDGPESYEKITLVMTEGKTFIETLTELLKNFESFNKDYKKATKGIKFVSNTSFLLTPAEESQKRRAAKEKQEEELARVGRWVQSLEQQRIQTQDEQDKEEVRIKEQEWEKVFSLLKKNLEKTKASQSGGGYEQLGGVLKELVDLKDRFDVLEIQEIKSIITLDSIEPRLKKATARVEKADSKGPMTPEERAVEEGERSIRAEFRTTPLPTECTPFGMLLPPSSPPPTLPGPPLVDLDKDAFKSQYAAPRGSLIAKARSMVKKKPKTPVVAEPPVAVEPPAAVEPPVAEPTPAEMYTPNPVSTNQPLPSRSSSNITFPKTREKIRNIFTKRKEKNKVLGSNAGPVGFGGARKNTFKTRRRRRTNE